MSWEKFKQSKLKSLDEAICKKEADPRIEKLLGKINKNPSIVSLSSCSGRVVLLMVDSTGKKNASFYAKWHDPVALEDFEMRLSLYNKEMPLWMRVEPFILHVACRDIDTAKGFMEKVREAGIKRGGIQTIKKEKITIEVQGSGVLAMPTEPVRSFAQILKIANQMLKDNLQTVKKLEQVNW